MFNYFKLKKQKLLLETLLLGKLYSLVEVIPDLAELATKLKDIDQKEVVSELVKYMKTNEKTGE
jgi:hypothetical protein